MITTKSRWLVAAVAAASLAGVTGVASATTPPAEMAGPSGALCAAVPAEGPGSAAAMAAEPLATAASSNPLLSTLVAAVTAGGLVDTLNGPGPFTVIAPINSAFDKVNPDTLKGLLADKDAPGVIEALTDTIDAWYAITLDGDRGRTGDELATLLRATGARAEATDIRDACRVVQTTACPGDRIVVLGSFHTVAPVLAIQPWLSNSPLPPSREA